MRVAIVGGGVMGCATALALAERGAECTILERAIPGAEASSAAAGILGAQVEAHASTSLKEFVRARDEYAAWAERLREDTGIDIGHRVTGVLRVAHTSEDHEALVKDVAWQKAEGLRAELLDARAARLVEPELAPNIVSAAHYQDDAQVEPRALLRALVSAAARAKVVVRSGARVLGLVVQRDRCVGVRLEGEELGADAVVIAAGSWSSLVPGMPPDVPAVRPVRGQMVGLEESPPRARSIVFGRGAYVVPRGDGRVLCGSTLENVGFKREVTAGGVRAILEGALNLIPSLDSATLSSTWSNFRPFTDAERPLVGESSLPGLFLATGHYRNGILLAKVTADAVASAILV